MANALEDKLQQLIDERIENKLNDPDFVFGIDKMPITDLIKKLDQLWVPDGDNVLLPHSVGQDALAVPEQSALSYANNWNDYNALAGGSAWSVGRVTRDGFGRVYISGLLSKAPFGTALYVGNELMFTIPARFRPKRQAMVLTRAGSTAGEAFNQTTQGRIDVGANGNCTLQAGAAVNNVNYVWLTGTWMAADTGLE